MRLIGDLIINSQMADPVDIDGALARRLRLEREARGWSQCDLARRSGVSKAMISKIEREETSPTAVLLARISVDWAEFAKPRK